MRAALYARVSSERQEKEHTIGSQVEALRAYAVKHGMEIVEEFTDEGYSGARLDRPALALLCQILSGGSRWKLMAKFNRLRLLAM
jgi:site-specific DNA recombinase